LAVQKRDSKVSGKNEEFLDKGKKALAQGEHELAISYFRQLLKWETGQRGVSEAVVAGGAGKSQVAGQLHYASHLHDLGLFSDLYLENA
jgi:hypothetical protein